MSKSSAVGFHFNRVQKTLISYNKLQNADHVMSILVTKHTLTLMNPHMIVLLALNLEVFITKVTLVRGRYINMLAYHMPLQRFQRLENFPTIPTLDLHIFMAALQMQIHGRFRFE
jgi:hypothetical protein